MPTFDEHKDHIHVEGAVGPGTVLGSGSLHARDIACRDIINIYGGDAQRITDYLSDIVARFGPLRERYIDLEGSAPPTRDPDDPFANLLLVTPVMRMEKENKPVPSVQAALDAHERLVMLGAPGAGKTISLRILLANAAERHLADPKKHPLPLLLGLNDWPNDAPTLGAWIRQHFSFATPMGSKLLLLLDGLNEMAGKDREQHVDLIRRYLREHKLARVIVTCREHDYTEALDLKLQKLVVYPLDDERASRLIHAYLPEDAAASLWYAIQPGDGGEWATERSLLKLSRNPYLLTLIVRIYRPNGSLPESTADLFRQLVRKRYEHEEERAPPCEPPPFDLDTFTHLLGDLAFAMIDESKGTSVDKVWAEQQIGPRAGELIRFGEACSVLVDSGGNVRFVHQLMQEYFAALALDWRGDVTILPRRNGWHYVLFMRASMGEEAKGKIIEGYISALSDAVWQVRANAISALEKIGDARAVPALINVLGDADKTVRQRAVFASEKIGDARAIPSLINMLGDADETVREHAAEALRKIGWQPQTQDQKIAYAIASQAWDECAQIGAPAVPALIAVLNDEDWTVCRRAVGALGEIGAPAAEAVPALFIILSRMDGYVKASAAWALWCVAQHSAAVPALITVLHDDKDKYARWYAASALGEIGDARAIPGLIAQLSDEAIAILPNKRVCDIVAEALRTIGTPEALTALREHGFDHLIDEEDS